MENEIAKALKADGNHMLGIKDMAPSPLANQLAKPGLKIAPGGKDHEGFMKRIGLDLSFMINALRRVKCHQSAQTREGFSVPDPLSLLPLVNHIQHPEGIGMAAPACGAKTGDS